MPEVDHWCVVGGEPEDVSVDQHLIVKQEDRVVQGCAVEMDLSALRGSKTPSLGLTCSFMRLAHIR